MKQRKHKKKRNNTYKETKYTRNCKTQKESGLSPFVFRKANQFAKNYSENELQKLSSNLIDIYHNARRGVKPLDIELEKFTLNI